MKQSRLLAVLFILLVTTLTSCEAIGDIFQAGMTVGIVIVVIVIILILWLVRKFRR
jgi:hypothetical protein